MSQRNEEWANLLETQTLRSGLRSKAANVPPEQRVLGSPFLTSWRRKRLENNAAVSACLSCLGFIMWCALVFVSHTFWCLEGSGCRTFHPRRSTGLWQGSTRHRPSRTHCSGGGEPGRCRCLSPHTAVAVRIRRGSTDVRRDVHDRPKMLISSLDTIKIKKLKQFIFLQKMFSYFELDEF